ncbi:MAG: TonB-dependent receptor [Thermoanaerobaculia bacterium]
MKNARPVLAAAFLCAFASGAGPAGAAEGPGALRGVVADEAGRAVAGANVTLETARGRPRTTTDSDGGFSLEASAPVTLRVEAPGFRPLERRVEPADLEAGLRLVLVAAGVSERLSVTATRTPARLADTAASVVVLSSEDLASSASPALDDALRQVPAFSLFRRSSSRTANPTSHGVSLRGAGASGASRAVVLDDGVPLNDPFGGWIYWGRTPRAAVERIEVLRGGASDLYGSAALGGAVQMLRRSPADPFAVTLETSYGSQDTPEASFSASGRRDGWGAVLSGEAFRTGGYVLVEEDARGPVDARAASRHGTVDLAVERGGGGSRLFLRGSRFEESRENGTPLQENDTESLHLAAGGDWRLGGGGLTARLHGADQDFRQTFSAIAADRATERLTRLQRVPSDAAGAALQWTGAAGGRHLLVAGAEGRQVRGESREEVLTDGGSSFVDAGGRERTASVFLEDIVTAGARWTLTAGVRFDRWWNAEARSATRAARDAAPVVTPLSGRSETAWSPRLSALHRLSGAVSLTVSAYRSFRAPTLNELYRTFRVGNALTLANEALAPERSRGVDAGAILSSGSGRLGARATLFWMEIEDAVGNVTLSVTPSLITRRRQNIGEIRTRGTELDFDWRPTAGWKLAGGYQLADATVRSSPAEPALAGLRVPQVPRHRVSLQAVYSKPALAAAGLSLRWTSSQFDDDKNLLPLASFWTADAVVSRSLWRGLEGFLAVENVFDERYEIGRTPVRTLGPPRALRGGLRLRMPD